MKKIWKEIEQDKTLEEKAKHIQEKFQLDELVSKIIASKNLKDDKEIEVFLNPKRYDFHNPFEMPDMEKAVTRIITAMENNEKIVVYGDYDADGITSSSIINRFMRDRNIDVKVYIPNRLDEGYGLNEDAIRKIASEGANLIITVDCGITAIEETELVKKLGMDIIITDHHEPGEQIPDAIAVIDCKRKDSKYPFRELAGCGVAFKLIQAISQKLEINENEYLKYLDIACIGTISDIVPLVDENRVIAKLGLLLVNQTRNVGIKELINISGYKKIDSSAISFGISPRINACGRMGHQEDALELLLTDDPIKARRLAKNLEDYNKQRQDIEKRIYNEAIKMIEEENNNENTKDMPCIILGNENWHHGVIGIVSSKITESYYKPSILICFEGEDAKGSGRSISGFDLYEALSKNSNELTAFGGHSMAIGLSLKTKNFNKFKTEFENYMKANIENIETTPEIKIDFEINSKDVSIKAIKELELLQPFGEANSAPIFIYKNLKIESIRTLSEGKHLKMNLQDEGVNIDVVGFGMGELANEYQLGDKIDIIGNANINSFNNMDRVQIILKDIRRAI